MTIKQEILQQMAVLFTEKMPFNQIMGMQVNKMTETEVEVQVPWSDNFIGNPYHKILHGGVTSTILDTTGGIMVATDIILRSEETSKAAILNKLSNLGTIDLRTDFLRPGRGELFIASAHLIRAGNKVAVARMEMHNEKGEHLAFGTGTYLVG